MADSGGSVAPATGPVIRVARPDDVAAAGALTAEAYVADGLLEDDDEYATELRDARRRAAEAVLLVAVAGTEDGREAVVGSITVAPYGSSYAEIAEPGEVELRMLAVAPEARHHGLAAQLMRAAQREALARDARRLVLSTLDAMVAEWMKGDADALATLLNEELDDPVLYKRLLTDRNAHWAQWIDQRLDRPGTVFVAVGAGHLAGQNSVQAQLRKRGIKARRLWE